MNLRSALVALFLAIATTACASGPNPADPEAFQALGIRRSATPMASVYTAGQPSEEQFAALPGVGVTKVVCLREADEDGTGWEETQAGALGIDFVRIPVAGADGITRENVDALDAACAGVDGPVLVYCGSSNRVGSLLALRAAWLEGVDDAAALQLGRDCGMTRLEPKVVEMLGEQR